MCVSFHQAYCLHPATLILNSVYMLWKSVVFQLQHKQKRLLVNALLASSIRVNSTLKTEAFQRAVVSVTTPRILVSLCHISFMDYAHEVISAGFKDTVVSLTKYGESSLELDVTVSTSLQVYVQNFVQLLNVSVLPRVGIQAMIHSSMEGVSVSTVVDPVALYLNHTTMLVLSTMDKILAAKTDILLPGRQEEGGTAATDFLLHDMRITLINEAEVDIWYRQEGTSECLQVKAKSRATYSWLSLASDTYYRMEFALEQEDAETNRVISSVTNEGGQSDETSDSVWSDPCVIKENCVTGRYFNDSGFLWICVELRGLQTVVTLRPPIVFRNKCGLPIHLMLNDEKTMAFKCGQLSTTSRRQHCSEANGDPQRQPAHDSLTPRREENAAYLMMDSLFRARVSKSSSAWSSPLVVNELPAEFDLVRPDKDAARDGQKQQSSNPVRGSKEQFVILEPEDDEDVRGVHFFGWLQGRRAECKTVLPNDFDPGQRQFAQRYAWMELALWPALAVENNTDLAVTLVFKQKVRARRCLNCAKSRPLVPYNFFVVSLSSFRTL